jgi:hypothetical protein
MLTTTGPPAYDQQLAYPVGFFLRALFIVLQTTVTVYPAPPNYSPPDYKLTSNS